MTKKIFLLLVAIALPAAAQPKDAPGCKDPALFPNRMPNYRIERCETKPFVAFEFNTAKPPKRRVEGGAHLRPVHRRPGGGQPLRSRSGAQL